jgi:hypothetical protein
MHLRPGLSKHFCMMFIEYVSTASSANVLHT